jgi:hypothetical protein
MKSNKTNLMSLESHVLTVYDHWITKTNVTPIPRNYYHDPHQNPESNEGIHGTASSPIHQVVHAAASDVPIHAMSLHLQFLRYGVPLNKNNIPICALRVHEEIQDVQIAMSQDLLMKSSRLNASCQSLEMLLTRV